MRASMAVPGAFSPVVQGDRVLSDGGLVRNLPVDVARELCADVVIAVWLSSPQPAAADLVNAVALAGRFLDVVIEANERIQIDSLAFIRPYVTVGPAARRAARASASSINWASGTTRLTRPSRSHSSAPTRSAVKNSSFAFAGPTSRGRNQLTP